VTWWHWAVLVALIACAHYLEKIRDLLGTIMLFMAHLEPQNPVAEHFLEDHREKVAVLKKHPSLGRLIWWWNR
jgi:hypothetical protein